MFPRIIYPRRLEVHMMFSSIYTTTCSTKYSNTYCYLARWTHADSLEVLTTPLYDFQTHKSYPVQTRTITCGHRKLCGGAFNISNNSRKLSNFLLGLQRKVTLRPISSLRRPKVAKPTPVQHCKTIQKWMKNESRAFSTMVLNVPNTCLEQVISKF